MMSVLHLLWIIPVSVYFGFLLFALFSIAADKDDEEVQENPRPTGRPPTGVTP